EPGGGEPLAHLALAMRLRGNLADVRVDHDGTHAGELARLQQVLDDVDLRAFAVQLQEDLVRFAQVLANPVGRANEPCGLGFGRRPELVLEDARAEAAGVVEGKLGRPVPQAELADRDSRVRDRAESRPARTRWLEAVDAIERILRIADRAKRLAVMGADIEEDLQRVTRPRSRAARGCASRGH